jgi:hypothetical protein
MLSYSKTPRLLRNSEVITMITRAHLVKTSVRHYKDRSSKNITGVHSDLNFVSNFCLFLFSTDQDYLSCPELLVPRENGVVTPTNQTSADWLLFLRNNRLRSRIHILFWCQTGLQTSKESSFVALLGTCTPTGMFNPF